MEQERIPRGALLALIIVVVLCLAICFTNIHTVGLRSKVAKVQADFNSFATAFEAYYADFGLYPDAEDWQDCLDNPENMLASDPARQTMICRFEEVYNPPVYVTTPPQDPYVRKNESGTPDTSYLYCVGGAERTDGDGKPDIRDASPGSRYDGTEGVAWEYSYPAFMAIKGCRELADQRHPTGGRIPASGSFCRATGHPEQPLPETTRWVIVSVGPDGVRNPGENGDNMTAADFGWWEYDPTNGLISNGDIVRFGP